MIRLLKPRVEFPRRTISSKLVGVLEEEKKKQELETKHEDNDDLLDDEHAEELSPMHSLATTVKTLTHKIMLYTRDHAKEYRNAVIKLGLVIIFYVTGTIYFTMGPEKWTIIQACYFLTVTTTTVGYGDVTPTHVESQGVAIVYIFFGLVVVLPILMGTAQNIMNWQVRQLNAIVKTYAESVNPVHVKIWYSSFLILIPMFLGCIFFGLQEAHNGPWNAMDPIWWTVATVTTIGYGDLTFNNVATARTFLIFFIPFSVITVGAALSNLSEVNQDMKELRRERELLNRFDIDMIKALDTDGDGIDRQEYILGMLQALGQVDPEKVEMYSRQFDEYDVDGSGLLDQDDLDLIGARLKEEAVHTNRKSFSSSAPPSIAGSPRNTTADDQNPPENTLQDTTENHQLNDKLSCIELKLMSGDQSNASSPASADGQEDAYVDNV